MDASKPRGRAALLQAYIRALPSPGETAAGQSSEEAPRGRGRAQLLAKLRTAQVAAKPTQIEKLAASSSTTLPESTRTQSAEGVTEALESLAIKSTFVKSAKGTSGLAVGVEANYVRLIRQEEKGFHKYEVKFEPEVDSKSARLKLVRANVAELGGVHLFDGGNNFYMPIKIQECRKIFQTPHPFDPELTVTVTFIYKREEPYGSQDGINFLNVLFKRVKNALGLKRIGRNYFDMESTKFIPQYNLQIIPGYAIAVDEMEGGLMVCLDTCHKLLLKKSVLEVLVEVRLNHPNNFRDKAYDELLGQVVLTTYNNATYIVDDILWNVNPTSTFETPDGPLSFQEYYKKRHGLEIVNLTQPLLLHLKKIKTKTPGKVEEMHLCLIPEFCNVTGIKQDMMTHKFKKDIAEHTRLPPAKRFETLRTYIRNVKSNPNAHKILQDWGFTLADGSIDLNARVLQDNVVTFKTKKIDVARTPDWGRETGSLINPIDISSWIVLYPERERKCTENFIARLREKANGFGCRIDPPRFIAIPGRGHDADYRKALETNVNDNIQMIFTVMPMIRESLYQMVKSFTLCRKGTLGQCILVRTLQNERNISSIALKVGWQMQAKLGGSLWAVVFPSICNNFMFCGIDTYHSPGGKKSVGALVCSIDPAHTNFYTGLAFQTHEIADALKAHFESALELRKKVTGSYPSLVFMVRDGVGDGQLQNVKEYELQQYLNAAKEIGANLKLVFIVVQKRVNTRFALKNGRNPLQGTVLDHTITRRQYDDFFLIPQSVTQGTVSPCHYIILQNDSTELNMDRIQKLCYKLCYMYYNWSGAISVPAPCQYAHKAAFLAGQYLERKPSDKLADKLYYL